MFAFSVSTIVPVGSLVDLTAGSSDSRATRKARAEWNNKQAPRPLGVADRMLSTHDFIRQFPALLRKAFVAGSQSCGFRRQNKTFYTIVNL
jgi:hypothetical protein